MMMSLEGKTAAHELADTAMWMGRAWIQQADPVHAQFYFAEAARFYAECGCELFRDVALAESDEAWSATARRGGAG